MKLALYCVALAASIWLVSVRGGHVAYLIFYFALFMPLVVLLYSLFVFARFKVGQTFTNLTVKGQEVPYSLKLANDEIFPFVDLRINFHAGTVAMSDLIVQGAPQPLNGASSGSLCVSPRSKTEIKSTLRCKYRGTYPVGVKSITVTDFFGIFSISYPLSSQMRITAKPRILPFERLRCALQEKDAKNDLLRLRELEETPDLLLKEYQPGDPKKRIHWKNSAKAGKLLVRTQVPKELFEPVLVLDLSPVGAENEQRLATEDKVIECALCFANHYINQKIPVHVVYYHNTIVQRVLDTPLAFESFYKKCADLPFESSQPVQAVWQEYACHTTASACLLLTAHATDSLRHAVAQAAQYGMVAIVVDAGELEL